MLDVGWCGGLTEARKIAALAEAYQRPVAPHDCNGPVVWVASIHLMLHIPNALVMEAVRAYHTTWYKDILTELPQVKDGYIYGLPGAGLGTRLLPDPDQAAGSAGQAQCAELSDLDQLQRSCLSTVRRTDGLMTVQTASKGAAAMAASSLRIIGDPGLSDVVSGRSEEQRDAGHRPRGEARRGDREGQHRGGHRRLGRIASRALPGRRGAARQHHARAARAWAWMPHDVVGVWNKIYVRQLGSHGMGAGTCLAMSGIDMALWDIRGKALGAPLYRLLGGASKPIPAYAGGVSLGYQEPKALVAEALPLVEAGYKAVKLRVGDTPARDLARVAAVRKAVGDDIAILVDANTGYSGSRRAQGHARLSTSYDVGWLEEPFPGARLPRATRWPPRFGSVPLAAGENHYTRFEFNRLIEDGSVTILQPDLSKTGGITEALRVAHLASAWKLPINPHTSMTGLNMAATIHFLAAIDNGGYFEGDVSKAQPVPRPARQPALSGGQRRLRAAAGRSWPRPAGGREISAGASLSSRGRPMCDSLVRRSAMSRSSDDTVGRVYMLRSSPILQEKPMKMRSLLACAMVTVVALLAGCGTRARQAPAGHAGQADAAGPGQGRHLRLPQRARERTVGDSSDAGRQGHGQERCQHLLPLDRGPGRAHHPFLHRERGGNSDQHRAGTHLLRVAGDQDGILPAALRTEADGSHYRRDRAARAAICWKTRADCRSRREVGADALLWTQRNSITTQMRSSGPRPAPDR